MIGPQAGPAALGGLVAEPAADAPVFVFFVLDFFSRLFTFRSRRLKKKKKAKAKKKLISHLSFRQASSGSGRTIASFEACSPVLWGGEDALGAEETKAAAAAAAAEEGGEEEEGGGAAAPGKRARPVARTRPAAALFFFIFFPRFVLSAQRLRMVEKTLPPLSLSSHRFMSPSCCCCCFCSGVSSDMRESKENPFRARVFWTA